MPAGVGAAGHLADLAVEVLQLGLLLRGGPVGLVGGGLLQGQDLAGLVDLLADDLEPVTGLGGELGGLLGGGGLLRVGGRRAGQEGHRQRGGGAGDRDAAETAGP
ncbi:hypothetical protein JD79_03944 [Geodermatophilus normandii]|uniref:Uncharacterized protein n=1 Tax=Geodermatophilus normandii TaxID=1137989 RepID=A0A317QP64_9ACTN|nr:hypothetical protein JD79_03944 [Geodermatophilus normandii]